MVVLRKSAVATGDFGGTKLSLLLEKQHNRGQDGAGAAILSANPEPGETPYWIAKSASATPLTDVLGMIGKRSCVQTGLTGLTRLSGDMSPDPKNPVNLVNPVKTRFEKIFLGHLRYATFGKNDVAFCHPFVHESSELDHTLLLAGNFNLTNAHELFDDYRHHGSFPTSKSDGYLITSLIAKQLEERSAKSENHISKAISAALANADGAWTLCGMTADGWAFATRDPHGIRPGWHYIDDDVVVVASERAAIQAAFDVPPEAVKELPPGESSRRKARSSFANWTGSRRMSRALALFAIVLSSASTSHAQTTPISTASARRLARHLCRGSSRPPMRRWTAFSSATFQIPRASHFTDCWRNCLGDAF